MVNSRESEKYHDILKLDMNYVVYKKSEKRRKSWRSNRKRRRSARRKISRGIRSVTAGNTTASS